MSWRTSLDAMSHRHISSHNAMSSREQQKHTIETFLVGPTKRTLAALSTAKRTSLQECVLSN